MARFGVVIIAVGLAALSGSSHAAESPVLNAIVGTNDGFNITLNGATGKKVDQLLPGTYTVVVDDRSRIHNFHLASNDDATVDFRTDIDFVGQKSFTVASRSDTGYAYACEPHWQVMNGSFFVTDAPPPPPPPPPPAGRTLRASVSPGGVDSRTGKRFRASSVLRVLLVRGVYRYGSDSAGLSKRLRVSGRA